MGLVDYMCIYIYIYVHIHIHMYICTLIWLIRHSLPHLPDCPPWPSRNAVTRWALKREERMSPYGVVGRSQMEASSKAEPTCEVMKRGDFAFTNESLTRTAGQARHHQGA